MSRLAILSGKMLAFACLLTFATHARAEKSAADLLPKTTLAYVEISQPKNLIAFVMDHPLRKDIETSDLYRKAVSSKDYEQFIQVLEVVEQKAGVQWRPALEAISGGGVVLAFDPATHGVVLLAKPLDATTVGKVRDTIFSLARDDANSKGLPDPIHQVDYRGFTAYRAGEATIADLGPWTLISNKPDLAKKVADAYLDGGDTLAGDHDFAEARTLAAGQEAKPCAWAFIHISALRDAGQLPPVFDAKKKSDNPGIELIAGGLLPIIQKAPYVAASLSLDMQGMKLSLAMPNDPSWTPAERKFYFAAPGDGAAKPLMPKGMVASISTYRDLAAMWQAGPDLFDDAVATKMAQADSGLSTVFGGHSFSTDVLGAIKPQMQFVAAKQNFKEAGIKEPQIKLPGMAMVLSVKPEQFDKVRRQFRVGFQTAVAFINLDGAQKGRPLLETGTEKRGVAEIQYATYGTLDVDTKKSDKPANAKDDLYLNFSPALVMSPKHMILCSTKALAEDLADQISKPDADATIPANTVIRLAPKAIADLLAANREQLVAQNMLDKGHERAAAEAEINLLQAVVGSFDDATVSLTPAEKSIRLDVELVFATKK